MKTLKAVICAVGLSSLMLAGCGNSVVKEAEALADEICACKDAECAKKVQEKFMEWAKKNKDAKGSESDIEKLTAVSKRIMECAMKIQAGGGAPAAGGDAKKEEGK